MDLESLFPDRSSGETLYAQLVRRLRSAIESGFFPPSSRLLPSRELAKRLGVARNTIASVLDQLVAEGYLETRIGAGTFVTATFTQPRKRAAKTEHALPRRAHALRQVKTELDTLGSTSGPLRLGTPDLSEFPHRAWQRISRKSLTCADAYLDYGQSAGLLALREAVSRHVAQFRGVVAESDQIVIVEGAQAAYHLIAHTLTNPGEYIAIEDPCYALARAAFAAYGLAFHAVPVDDHGIRTAELPEEAALAYVTPSHQFPLGGALPLNRRMELLDWARRTNAYVIEDDYDSEFDARPLPALQSLDRDERVIYVGTFSKTLAPGLRLGYIIVPPHLAQTFRLARAITSLGASAHLQATLADFINQGYFARHVRHMAAIYERRRGILVETLSAMLSPDFVLGPAQTGLHITITAPADFDDVRFANSMKDGQRCLPLSLLCVHRDDCRGLVVGYSAEDDETIRRAATALGDALLAQSRT